MSEFVELEVSEGIGTIRLNRPPMNALNQQVAGEFTAAARNAGADDNVRAVIVYGGTRIFAAGADIKEMQDRTYAQMASDGLGLSAAVTAIAEIEKPTVAAITGYALGGGLELALGCDRRVAGDNVKVGQPEMSLGVIPGAGGTQRLTRLVGPSKAKDLVYTGRFVESAEALNMGLLDQVVVADEVYDAAWQWARQFTRGPAKALAAAKAAIDGGIDTDINNGLKLESHLFAAMFATEDQKIGMRSFIENGPGQAEFLGR